jgi:phosphohistidine phosphatase SixA
MRYKFPLVRPACRVLMALLLCAVMPIDAQPPQTPQVMHQALATVIVVRHAERADDGTKDPPLSAAGEARAKRLASHLQSAEIAAAYVTPLKRTQQTAALAVATIAPTITTTTLPAADIDALIARIRLHRPNETVLVVGHSNTVPRILQALGMPNPPTIAEDEYHHLFVVTPDMGTSAARGVRVLQLRY